MTTLLLFVLLRVGAQPVTGEMSKYLDNPKVYDGAKDYYNDIVKTTVNDTTRRILDSLNTQNVATRPFYLLMTSKMLMYTEAGLAELLFKECYAFLGKRPDDLADFLYKSNKFVLSDYKNYWATAVAYQLHKEHAGEEKEYLEQWKGTLEKQCRKKSKAHLSAFIKLVNSRL